MVQSTNDVRVETFNFHEIVTLIGGDTAKVYIKEATIIESPEGVRKIGDLVGHLDIIYPFAGLDLELTLDIYEEMVDEDLDINDGVIKLPFVEDKILLHDLFFYRSFMEEQKEVEKEMELLYIKCSCGGYMMPMYDEFPNWITFCSRCDSRNENSEASPIVEP
ncbi:hypothetical protein WMO40_20535 [Bacillaceae bacterium CLA-AA-H227]|uniref:Uncharacterized protein n=1 Tax=Robertmurraya yapensis (ex Hitch et al 2024) TaxID=3133160 RepID=A0ACC6SG97_9BACI